MDLSAFLQKRRPDWKRLEEILRRVEGSGLASLEDAQAIEFGILYRRAASDLNQAQTFVSGGATVQYLNTLVARCYLVIYARGKLDLRGALRQLVFGFPATFRRQIRPLLLSTALFFFGTLFAFLASYFDPDVARVMLLPSNFPTIEPGQEGPLMDSGQLSSFSSFLFTNNMSVSLIAFALGITLGIGTAWLLFSNGVFMGTLAAVFVEAGEFRAFATGILPHGVLEIPACLIAGAAGFLLARGIIRAGPRPRLEELARDGAEALRLLSGCLPLLVAAAILEAGVARAPDAFLSSGLKLSIAGFFAVLFLAYVLLLGRSPTSSQENP